MIRVTRFDGSQVVVNAGHILMVESTPDTVLTLTTGYRLMVREPVSEVVLRVVEYRRVCSTPSAAEQRDAWALAGITNDDSPPALDDIEHVSGPLPTDRS